MKLVRLPPIRLILSLALLATSLWSCGDAGDPGFRVALISPGPISDDGWNAAAYEGLRRVEAELGAVVRQVQVRSPSEFEGAFRDFGRSGYDLVFAHGFEFSETARAVAPDFPGTVFVITSGVVAAENVSSIQYAVEEPARLAGVLAAKLSRSGRVGCVGGLEIPPVKRGFDAFRAGFMATRPDGAVTFAWVGSWEDVAAAHAQTLALLDQGADVIFHNADAAGLGVFNAAEERGALAIGCNKDQSEVKPDTVVASVVLDIPESFVRVAREVSDGAFHGELLRYDLKSGVVYLAYNERLRARTDDEVRGAVEQARLALLGDG